MRPFRHQFLFFLLLFSANTFAQNNGQELIFGHINERNGLSYNIVNAIIKDRNGFMWIATFDGLNRFDGTHFIHFRNNRNQPSSIHQNTVHDLCLDQNGDIWCANQTAICRFDQRTQTFENFFPETKRSGASYVEVVCDAWGNIWCASNYGVYKYDRETGSFTNYNAEGPAGLCLSGTAIFKRGLALSSDKRSLWIATVKGINYFDIASNIIYNYKNNPQQLPLFDSVSHYPICLDKKNRLVYGSIFPSNRVNYFDPETKTVTDLDIIHSKQKSNSPASNIFVDKDNRYWVSTWGYASFIYDPATGQAKEFSQEKELSYSLSGDFFWDAYQDEEGTIWLGTINGLSYTNPDIAAYRLYEPLKNGGPEMAFTAINRYFEDSEGKWWLTKTGSTNLYRYDPVSGKLENITLPGKNINILFFAETQQHLLLATLSGLYYLNIKTGQPGMPDNFSKLNALVGKQVVHWLRIIGDSVACMMTEHTGLIRYDLRTHDIKTISLEENDFLKKNINFFKNCVASTKGPVYLVFNPLKIARYDWEKDRFDSLPVNIPPSVKLLMGPSMGVKEDKDGNLWIAIKEAGLAFYDISKQEIRFWQESDGLVFNHVFDDAIDASGKIWLAAYNKFSLFDPVKNKFQNFTLSIGEDNYVYFNHLVKLHNGNILANISRTFVEWLPDKIKKNNTIMPVLISRLILQDSIISPPGNKIRLNHSENNFSIEFGILTGLDKSRYRLEYKLDGFDASWKQADQLNTAVYTNVPEKDFIFRVRAISINSGIAGKETTLVISVIPPFYRTTWFKILSALLAATLIVWLIRIRINSIRKTEKQKSSTNKLLNEWKLKALRSQMNPHFIFNCMNSIDLYILKNDAENASLYLNKFAKLVRLILNQSNDMYVPLSKEMEMLKYYLELEALRFDYPFSYTINCDNNINPDETEIPSMLLQPYVENAILHGLRHKKESGKLTIQISRKANQLLCVIEDNGVGKKASAIINASRTGKHESRGTILAEERLKVMEDKKDNPVVTIIDLANAAGVAAGTRVEITIPIEIDD